MRLWNLSEEIVEFKQTTSSNNINEIDNEDDLVKNIITPSKVHVREHPKSATLTVVGFPRKRIQHLRAFVKKKSWKTHFIVMIFQQWNYK